MSDMASMGLQEPQTMQTSAAESLPGGEGLKAQATSSGSPPAPRFLGDAFGVPIGPAAGITVKNTFLDFEIGMRPQGLRSVQTCGGRLSLLAGEDSPDDME